MSRRQSQRTSYVANSFSRALPLLHLNVHKLLFQLAILNAGSTLGRILPVALADRAGVYNMLLPAILASAVLLFSLFAATDTAGVVTVAALFGFSSGACA